MLWRQTRRAVKTELEVVILLALFLASPWLCRWEQTRCSPSSPTLPPVCPLNLPCPLALCVGRGCAGVFLQACGSSSSAWVPPGHQLCPTSSSLRSTPLSQSFNAQFLVTLWKRERCSRMCCLKALGDFLPFLVWNSPSS